MSENQNQNNQLNIELTEEIADGIYSNMAMLLPKIPLKLWGAIKGRLQH